MYQSSQSKVIKWRQSDRQVSSAVANEYVLMGLENSLYYGLKNTASSIWQLLECPRSTEEIVNALVDEYDVTWAQCQRDVTEFLEKLAAASLICKDE